MGTGKLLVVFPLFTGISTSVGQTALQRHISFQLERRGCNTAHGTAGRLRHRTQHSWRAETPHMAQLAGWPHANAASRFCSPAPSSTQRSEDVLRLVGCTVKGGSAATEKSGAFSLPY